MDTTPGHERLDGDEAAGVTSPSHRIFVLASALLLTGCATGTRTAVSSLPDPFWSIPRPARPVTPGATPTPVPMPGSVLPRSAWAQGKPVPSRMDTGRRITRITVHHDGMKPFTQTTSAAASGRLESIRRAHLRRKPQRFGDIGYHYAIDPAGRVWACRPLTYQGAHVAGQNPGNLGIVLLGNYDKQSINRAQQAALLAFLKSQSTMYGIPEGRVRTHQEMAPTACPGSSLQRYMVAIRRNGTLRQRS